MFFFHDTVDILHHYDRIVDDYTDRKNKSQQRHHVKRKAEYEHYAERSDQRNRHCDGRYQSSPPALQGQEHDEDDQEQGFEEGLVYMMDRLGNICRHIKRDVVGHPFRKAFADLFHCSLDIIGHFHRIGSREQKDIHYGCITAVYSAFRIV